MRKFKCYSAGPDLFPRTLPDGHRETWAESERRAHTLNQIISSVPEFEVITPTNTDLNDWPENQRARVCLYKDLLLAAHSDIIFANVTPFGGREPDAGTVVEAVTGALFGGLLVLWADPLTTFAEKYADADVHPDSELDLHYNLMLEQLYYWSWEEQCYTPQPVFGSLEVAVQETARQIRDHGLFRGRLINKINSVAKLRNRRDAIRLLLGEQLTE